MDKHMNKPISVNKLSLSALKVVDVQIFLFFFYPKQVRYFCGNHLETLSGRSRRAQLGTILSCRGIRQMSTDIFVVRALLASRERRSWMPLNILYLMGQPADNEELSGPKMSIVCQG